MAKSKGYIEVNKDLCKGCGLCVEACPQDVLDLSENVNIKGYHFSNMIKEGCTGCTNCGVICPDGVITVYREKKKD